jgi:mycoredoxin-dependent peroxiredoxin
LRGVFGEDIRKLCVGDIAPDFDVPVLLKGVKGRFRLSDWVAKHKYLLIVFYPLNWEDLSAGRVVELQAQREKYVSLSAECVTVSVDSIMNTTAWEREIGPFDFPMCSDFWPHGEVCRKYGVLQGDPPQRGSAHTTVFVIDDKSTVRFEKSYGREEEFSVDALVAILKRF